MDWMRYSQELREIVSDSHGEIISSKCDKESGDDVLNSMRRDISELESLNMVDYLRLKKALESIHEILNLTCNNPYSDSGKSYICPMSWMQILKSCWDEVEKIGQALKDPYYAARRAEKIRLEKDPAYIAKKAEERRLEEQARLKKRSEARTKGRIVGVIVGIFTPLVLGSGWFLIFLGGIVGFFAGGKIGEKLGRNWRN
jgi:hypothetical protein